MYIAIKYAVISKDKNNWCEYGKYETLRLAQERLCNLKYKHPNKRFAIVKETATITFDLIKENKS